MDIDQLRTFDRIARDLSFTKAAARLNVTQATVSMRMRVLEDFLGVQLFTRGRITVASLRSMVTPLVSESLLRFQERHREVDVIVREGHHNHVTAMLHDRQAELGIIAWPNLDPLVPEIYPIVVMREPVP